MRCTLIAGLLIPLSTVLAQECASCHRQQAELAATSPMTHALQRARDSDLLRANPELSFRSGNFVYSIRREGDRSVYSVTDRSVTISAPIEWAFGAGIVGQTFLYQRDGAYYEAAVSFYPARKSLDWTPGHADRPRRNLEEAAGRKIDSAELRRCFGCHSEGVNGPEVSALQSVAPGIQCVQCHLGATQHAGAMVRGGHAPVPAKLATMEPEELASLCTKCHPSWADIAANGPHGVENVRFQFYRLTDSRCYDSADKRIACTACHDPHGSLGKDSDAYDSVCQKCHQLAKAQAKLCPVSKRACITCHMPKVELPGLHYQFTDHRIRIARAGEKYPD